MEVEPAYRVGGKSRGRVRDGRRPGITYPPIYLGDDTMTDVIDFKYGDERLPERFWSKVEIAESGCWEWSGAVGSKGYGTFGAYDPVPSTLAHRIAFVRLVGPIEEGLQIDHLCRVRHCVNPIHLEPVTGQENVLRGDVSNRGQTHCKNGHEFTAENARVRPTRAGISRTCRQCGRDVRNSTRPSRAKWKRLPNHCLKGGHEFTDENTYIAPNGKRACKACKQKRARESYARSRG